jgi:hypothetical protein
MEDTSTAEPCLSAHIPETRALTRGEGSFRRSAGPVSYAGLAEICIRLFDSPGKMLPVKVRTSAASRVLPRGAQIVIGREACVAV